jgi:tetratricopeptide (TPR) repeat protein
MLETIREYAREQLDAAAETDEIAARHALRYAVVAREIRDGVEGATQVEAVERGIAEEGNIQAALETLLSTARAGGDAGRETGLQLSGDLWMYWHIRGKNVSAREWADAFLALGGEPSVGRAGALITAGLASWITGQFERANEEWGEAYRLAVELGAAREECLGAACQALGLLGIDPEAALGWGERGIEQSKAHGFDWALGTSLTFAGIASAILGDEEGATARYTEALRLQEPVGDHEMVGMSLSGLAALAAGRGDSPTAFDLYRRSLASFETIGDRAEEARILSEMAATYLADGDAALARRCFFEAIQAHTDVASVRGVGLSLLGLAAAEAVEGRPELAVQIAAAAEVYAQEEGIVNVYSDETPGSELVEQARASLSADELARAGEIGRRLSIQGRSTSPDRLGLQLHDERSRDAGGQASRGWAPA